MGKVVGFTCTCGDLLHAGHNLMLKECKSQCDFLIVGLQSDPAIDRPTKHKPIQSLYERWVQLTSSKYVDLVIPYDTEEDLKLILSTQKIDVRFVGEDYLDKDFTGKDLCKQLGIEIIYNSRKHNLSTTELRKRIAKAEQEKN